MALELTKAEIRDRGDKISKYTLSQLRIRAEEMIGPWLWGKPEPGSLNEILNAKVRMDRALPVNETHAQNGASQ